MRAADEAVHHPKRSAVKKSKKVVVIEDPNPKISKKSVSFAHLDDFDRLYDGYRQVQASLQASTQEDSIYLNEPHMKQSLGYGDINGPLFCATPQPTVMEPAIANNDIGGGRLSESEQFLSNTNPGQTPFDQGPSRIGEEYREKENIPPLEPLLAPRPLHPYSPIRLDTNVDVELPTFTGFDFEGLSSGVQTQVDESADLFDFVDPSLEQIQPSQNQLIDPRALTLNPDINLGAASNDFNFNPPAPTSDMASNPPDSDRVSIVGRLRQFTPLPSASGFRIAGVLPNGELLYRFCGVGNTAAGQDIQFSGFGEDPILPSTAVGHRGNFASGNGPSQFSNLGESSTIPIQPQVQFSGFHQPLTAQVEPQVQFSGFGNAPTQIPPVPQFAEQSALSNIDTSSPYLPSPSSSLIAPIESSAANTYHPTGFTLPAEHQETIALSQEPSFAGSDTGPYFPAAMRDTDSNQNMLAPESVQARKEKSISVEEFLDGHPGEFYQEEEIDDLGLRDMTPHVPPELKYTYEEQCLVNSVVPHIQDVAYSMARGRRDRGSTRHGIALHAKFEKKARERSRGRYVEHQDNIDEENGRPVGITHSDPTKAAGSRPGAFQLIRAGSGEIGGRSIDGVVVRTLQNLGFRREGVWDPVMQKFDVGHAIGEHWKPVEEWKRILESGGKLLKPKVRRDLGLRGLRAGDLAEQEIKALLADQFVALENKNNPTQEMGVEEAVPDDEARNIDDTEMIDN